MAGDDTSRPGLCRRDSWLARAPLTAFFLLSCGFFWGYLALLCGVLALLGHGIGTVPGAVRLLLLLPGVWAPTAAAVCVTRAGEGGAAARRLLAQCIGRRISLRWCCAASLPFALAFLAAGLFHLYGGRSPGGANLTVSFFLVLLVGNVVRAAGQEIGWRGFALRRLLERHDPVRASLILAVLLVVWNIPLWFVGGYSGLSVAAYIVGLNAAIASLTFVMTWVYLRTSRSLLPVILLHFSFDAAVMLVGGRGMGLVRALPLLAIMAGLLMLFAAIVVGGGGLSRAAYRRHVLNNSSPQPGVPATCHPSFVETAAADRHLDPVFVAFERAHRVPLARRE